MKKADDSRIVEPVTQSATADEQSPASNTAEFPLPVSDSTGLSTAPAKKRVLAVDDDSRILQVLRFILEDHGFEVHDANSALEGLEKAKSNDYDFVLVDLKMPDNDGLWFVRNAKLPRKTKVLLVTAYLDRNIVNEMFKYGIVGYVSKPFDEDEIIRHLEFHSQGQSL